MLKLFFLSTIIFILSGCSSKEEFIKIKFDIKNLQVKETNNTWNSQSDPNEAPFFGLSFDKKYFVGGTFVFNEDNNYVKGQVNLIDIPLSEDQEIIDSNQQDIQKNLFKKSIVGYWPVINCYNDSEQIFGTINVVKDFHRTILIDESCLYIKIKNETLESSHE